VLAQTVKEVGGGGADRQTEMAHVIGVKQGARAKRGRGEL
jgi:hypothetical protein